MAQDFSMRVPLVDGRGILGLWMVILLRLCAILNRVWQSLRVFIA